MTEAATAKTSPWRAVARNAGARMLVLPISAILGIVCTRLIIDNYGQAAYVQYGLVIGLAALLPFADLGMSAAVINAVAGSGDPAHDDHPRRVLLTSLRVLLCSAAVLVAIVGLISVFGLWPTIIGDGLISGTGPAVAALSMIVFAVGMPLGFGDRILTGLGKNHVTILLSALLTPVVLLCLFVFTRTHVGAGPWLPLLPYTITVLLSVTSCVIAARMLRPAVGWALRRVRSPRRYPGAKVLGIALPMLVQMIALPIAMQTDRIVLSHVSTLGEVAKYSLASQMYSPIWIVVGSAGVALWPIFAKQRSRGVEAGGRRLSPLPMSRAFAAAAALVCLLVSLASSWLADRASGGTIHLDLGLLLAFSALMIMQAAKYPLGMYMTDERGMRFQALMIVLLMPVNLGLSIWLANVMGAAGPVVGSAVGVFLCQVVANYVYVRRALAAERRAADSAVSGADVEASA